MGWMWMWKWMVRPMATDGRRSQGKKIKIKIVSFLPGGGAACSNPAARCNADHTTLDDALVRGQGKTRRSGAGGCWK